MISLALVATLNYFIAYDADLRYANYLMETGNFPMTIESILYSEVERVEAKIDRLDEIVQRHEKNIMRLDTDQVNYKLNNVICYI